MNGFRIFVPHGPTQHNMRGMNAFVCRIGKWLRFSMNALREPFGTILYLRWKICAQLNRYFSRRCWAENSDEFKCRMLYGWWWYALLVYSAIEITYNFLRKKTGKSKWYFIVTACCIATCGRFLTNSIWGSHVQFWDFSCSIAFFFSSVREI